MTPLSKAVDQLRKLQPEASKVVLPEVTGRFPSAASAFGQLVAKLKPSPQGSIPLLKIPFQGFASTPGKARVPHPQSGIFGDGMNHSLAITHGFRDIRRRSK